MVALGARSALAVATAALLIGVGGLSSARAQAPAGDLSLFTKLTVNGNYVAAGTGLRGQTSGSITIAGVPSGSTVTAAYLYWGYLDDGESESLKNITFEGTAFTGTKTGTNADTCWGRLNSHGYRADVTSKVTGNGTYAISGVASGGQILAEGASLVVIYANPDESAKDIVLYDGNEVVDSGGEEITNTLGGFAASAPVSAKTTFIVGDGQDATELVRFTGSLGTLNLNDSMEGSDPPNPNVDAADWDTDTHNVSSFIAGGDTSASAFMGQPSSGGDCLMWVAQAFSVTTTDATIALAADEESVIAGAQSVPTGGIDLADLHRTGGGNTESTPLDAIPLDAIPLDAIPLDAIPLDAIGFTSDMLQEALGGVHLSDVPLSTAGGWEAELAGTPLAGVPLNTVTLADVYALNEAAEPDAIPLDAIPLDAIDLSQTPLDAIGLGAIALGATPLDAIPLDAIGTNSAAENLDDWCKAIDALPGYDCSNASELVDETLIGIAVDGIPLDAIPLDAIPLDAIPLDAIPLDAIPLDAIPLDAIPLDAIPLDAIPLDAIPLDAIDFAVSPLDAIPLDAIGPGIVDCSGGYCDSASGNTLGDAATAQPSRLLPGVTLLDLMRALLPGNGATVADLIYGLPSPPELTLGDLFALVLGGKGPYDWSDLDLNEFPIALHSPDGGVITYRVTFSVASTAADATATIRATLPQGGVYKPSSTNIANLSNEVAVAFGEPTVEATALEWEVEVEPGDQYELRWRVHAPLQLGEYPVTANIVVPGMQGARLSAPVSVDVTQTLEDNDTPGTGPTLEDDTLYLSHMLRGDVDRYVVPIPEAFGSTVEIKLSHIAEGTDLDLTVAGPPSPTLRAAPLDAIPLQNGQLPDTEVDLAQRTQALPTETLQDVPTDAITAPPNVVRATSDNRANADEEVRLVSQGEAGNYLVQVSDYQGDSSLPYMLEVKVSGPPSLGACAPRSFAHLGEGVAGTMPTTLPANLNTLFLVNQERLGDTYGAAAAGNVIAKLNQLASRSDLGIVGAVIPVESDPGVAAAYGGPNGWDASPCSPQKANDVVREIGELIDSIEPANLRYKVIVGGDDQIPFGRVPDETLIANESTYASTLAGPNNQYKGAFGNGFLLTDDVWAEESAPQLFGHQLFVPDQAVGRLLETPGDITGMIDAFLAAGGAIAPSRSLTTGYDFLTDGADAVNTPLKAVFGANAAQTLISEDWVAKDPATGDVANDLEDALFPGTNPPQVSSINAHFDHTRLLPAAENRAQRAANLYVSQNILDRGAGAVDRRVLFSMGCHSGLAISDQIYGGGDPLAKDWAQAFLSGGAFAWIGNNGYGLGDTVDVAYTERLHALLSGNLTKLTIGEALAQAKQEYLSTLGVVGPYDAKVVMEATLFGLPMLRVGTGAPPAPPAPLPTHVDPATGLQAASFNVSPSFTLVPPLGEPAPDGRFYRAQTTQTTNRRPIEPVFTFDITQPGKVAHGIVITSLTSLPDETGFDAAFSRVVTDHSDDEPELVGEAAYPAKIQSISTSTSFASPQATRQHAVLIAGLYRSDGVPDPSGIGTHRLYTQIGGYVLYKNSGAPFEPPELEPLETQDIGTGIGFAVEVTASDGAADDVKVLYRDCSNTWRLSTLRPSGGNRWSGGGALAAGCDEIDYYVQAVNAGDVAVSSKKVQIKPLTLPPPTGQTQISFSLAGTQHGSGWYTGGVGVTITPSSALEYSLDGGAFQPYPGTFTVSADGVHTVEARAADGSTKTVGFAIDTTDPTVLITTPPAGAVYHLNQVVKAEFTCADAGSGPVTCSGTPANGATLNTGSLGTKAITVTATDAVGRRFTVTRAYQVVYAFQGFFDPVKNPPVLNAQNAGSVIPMKFSLGGNQGLNIFASGFPKSQQINCTTRALMGKPASTAAQPPGLKYTASSNTYEYLWKTDGRWKGTCRAFFLGLKDGRSPRADFRFT